MSEPGPGPDPEIRFRSLSAPGLEEDDIYAALQGLPVPGPYWGDGRPWPAAEDPPWDDEDARRRRHEELLRKWPPRAEGDATSGPS